jgi:hypothetical protein
LDSGAIKEQLMTVELEAYWDGETWCARAKRYSIYTFADTLDKLLENIKEAVALYFEDTVSEKKPIHIVLKEEP